MEIDQHGCHLVEGESAAIAVSCPSCEAGLRVKDQLAGRKVKCPKCGDAFTIAQGAGVPSDEGIRARKNAPQSPATDEEDESDRPRRKKGKRRCQPTSGTR